jgi:hypothetical protein
MIVPVLCPDASGGSAATGNGERVDLDVFADHLGALARADGQETLIVAGADLGHVGARFGDVQALDEDFCREVEQRDRSALEAILSGHAEGFLSSVQAHQNSTRICSTGCLYVATRALRGARAELLRYHQAIDSESQTGVTCASMVFWQG